MFTFSLLRSAKLTLELAHHLLEFSLFPGLPHMIQDASGIALLCICKRSRQQQRDIMGNGGLCSRISIDGRLPGVSRVGMVGGENSPVRASSRGAASYHVVNHSHESQL